MEETNTEQEINWIDEMIIREATPKQLRTDTVDEFCAKFSIPTSNYYYHAGRPENKKKVINTTVDNVKTHAPEILEKLVEKAKGGDIKAIDLYMDMILQLAKNLDLKTDGRPIIQIAKEIAEKNNLNESNA